MKAYVDPNKIWSWSKARMSPVTHPLQHFSRTDHADALEGHDGKVSIGGKHITNYLFILLLLHV